MIGFLGAESEPCLLAEATDGLFGIGQAANLRRSSSVSGPSTWDQWPSDPGNGWAAMPGG